MSLSHAVGAVVLAVLAAAAPAAGQSIVLDEGTFAITLHGKPAGTETFAIQQAGSEGQGRVIAHGVVTLSVPGGTEVIRPLLEAPGLDSAVNKYQVKVSGPHAMELRLSRSGNRYVSLSRSSAGEEELEFLARPDTRILEQDVAHQYYFLRNVPPGGHAWVIEPRARRQIELVASAWTDESLRLNETVVAARKVTFSAGSDRRIVWFDRQGRVLRVEIPARGYVAERRDLVG